jgi:hypothetical protein
VDGNTKKQTAAQPVTADRDAQYERLLDAEHRLYTAARRRGASEATISASYEASAPDLLPGEDDDEETIFGLARSIVALGGHLEVVAVFDDERVTLLREPVSPD